MMGVMCQKKKQNGFVVDSAKVKLLLAFNGNFNDSSPNNIPMTSGGNISISAIDPKFGSGKLQYGSTPRDGYLKTTNAFFNFGNKRPFTLSFWTKSGDGNGCYVTTRNTAIYTPFELSRGGFFQFANATLDNWVFAPFAVNNTNWLHIALVADGNRIKGYNQGIAQFDIAHPNWPSVNLPLIFGKNGDNNYSDGSLDDFLLYDGALWTDNFSPPEFQFMF